MASGPIRPLHPLHDIVTVYVTGGSPWAVHVAAAVAAALAAGALALAIWRIGGEQATWLATGFAFIPVVFIGSTNGTDLPWTLAGLCFAIWLALEDRPWATGVALGLGLGFRGGAAAAGLIAALLIAGRAMPHRGWQLAKLSIATCLTTAVVYAPVVRRYGFGFWAAEVPEIITVEPVRPSIVDVWGATGLLGFAVCAIAAFGWSRRSSIFSSRTETTGVHWRWTAWLFGCAGAFILWLDRPLIAWTLAAPFVVLMAAERLRARFARVLAVCLLLAPWALGIRPSDSEAPPAWWRTALGSTRLELLRGPVVHNYAMRQDRLHTVARISTDLDRLRPGDTIIVGRWGPMLSYLVPKNTLAQLRVQDGLPAAGLVKTSTTNPYYVLPGIVAPAVAESMGLAPLPFEPP